MLNEITFDYDKTIFDWSNSKLYYFLCDHYGLNDVSINLKDGTEIIVDKHNVLGNSEGEDYITLYNNIGELEALCCINLEDIKNCRVR